MRAMMNVEFKLAMIRENIKSMMKAQSKKDVDFLYEWVSNDLKDLRNYLVKRFDSPKKKSNDGDDK